MGCLEFTLVAISLFTHLAHKPCTARLQEKKKKWEPPPPPPRVGRKQRRAAQASSLGSKLPAITPNAKCKLRLLKLERVKDWLLMEQEFVANQERLKPQEERNEEDRSKVSSALLCFANCFILESAVCRLLFGRLCYAINGSDGARLTSCDAQVDDLRGSPMSVGNLEEIIDEKCACPGISQLCIL